MKNLSKVLALTLLLAPAAAQADQWCSGNHQHLWNFASGQVPFTYLCGNGPWTTQAQALTWAQTKCQQAWDNLPSSILNQLIGGFVPTVQTIQVSSISCSWTYRCRTCVNGFLPHPVVRDRLARLGPAEAGVAAEGAVKGQVLSIDLHDASGEEPFYLVDVITDTEQVQVAVDATTGEARVVKPGDDEVSCQP